MEIEELGITERELKEQYDEMLDDVYAPINICGVVYSPSVALFRVDEIAYRCGMNDYESMLIEMKEEEE
jgi:hypothetical protein